MTGNEVRDHSAFDEIVWVWELAMGAQTGDSRDAIRVVAAATFCEYGYRASTLEQIGAQVGLTRATILHHYRTKAQLLNAVVSPYLAKLDRLLLDQRVDDPPTSAQRRRLLIELADLFVDDEASVRLLTTDVTARVQVRVADRWAQHHQRLVTLLFGSNASEHDRIRVSAALGTMIIPVATSGLDLSGSHARHELVESALAVLERPGALSAPIATAAAAVQ